MELQFLPDQARYQVIQIIETAWNKADNQLNHINRYAYIDIPSNLLLELGARDLLTVLKHEEKAFDWVFDYEKLKLKFSVNGFYLPRGRYAQ